MTGAFLDTVGLIAIWDSTDQWHTAAAEAFRELLLTKTPLYTSSYILLECGNAASRRPYRNRVQALRTELLNAGMCIEPTSEEVEIAWQAFDRGDAGQAGIVDHVSFILMRRLKISHAFTSDMHYRAAGFETCW